MTSLSHLEFDLLWEHLGLGELPYPLDVASHGVTMDERAVLRAQVRDSLVAKGLHNGQDVAPRFTERLAMLVRNDFSVDGQLSVGEHLKVLAAGEGDRGVLVAQSDDELRVASVREGRVVPAVIALLPDEKPGPGGAARLPKAAFDEAVDEFGRGGYVALERVLAGAGVTGRELRTVITLVESGRHGGGQLAANRVDRMGRRRRSPVLNWFDTEAGRYLAHTEVGRDRTEVLTVAPADRGRIEQRLAALVAGLEIE